MIFHRPEDQSVSGWQFNIRLEDIERIQIPMVVYGIGFNQFPFDTERFPPILNRHLGAVKEKASLFAVRNNGTLAELARRGVNTDQVDVIMDAGAFAPASPFEIPGLDSRRYVIGLNIAGDRPEHRYPEPALSNMAKVYETIALGLRDAARDYDAQILYIPHIVEVDEFAFGIFKEILGENLIVNLRAVVPHMYPPSAAYASFLVYAYTVCDVVMGMRGHACIIPFGKSRKVIALGDHRKNSFFMEDVGLREYTITARSIIDNVIGAHDISATVTRTLSDESLSPKIATHARRELTRFTEFNRKVVSLLDKAPASKGL